MSSSKHFSENDIRVCYDAYLNICLVRGLEPLKFLMFVGVVDGYHDLGWISKSDSPNKVISMVTSNYAHKHVFSELSCKTENDIKNMPNLGRPTNNAKTNATTADDNILKEAFDITEGARASDYGSADSSFTRIAMLSNLLIGVDSKLNKYDIAKVLMAVKLVRESFKHKRDNLVDLCGYARLLQDLHGK